jgi:hypothetical protein
MSKDLRSCKAASSPDVWDNAYEALIELDFAELTSYQVDMGRVDAVSKIYFVQNAYAEKDMTDRKKWSLFVKALCGFDD